MNYECSLLPFGKIMVSTVDVVEPLCNSCKSPDCSNPIVNRTISVFGEEKTFRLWSVNNAIRQVVSCKGYLADAVIDEEDKAI